MPENQPSEPRMFYFQVDLTWDLYISIFIVPGDGFSLRFSYILVAYIKRLRHRSLKVSKKWAKALFPVSASPFKQRSLI